MKHSLMEAIELEDSPNGFPTPNHFYQFEADLVVIGFGVLLGAPLVVATAGPLRVVLGFALVLLLPGYALTAAAFPGQRELEPLERLVLSFGLSVGSSLVVGLALSYSPWGAKMLPSVISLAVLCIAASSVASYRRRQLPPEWRPPGLHRLWLSLFRLVKIRVRQLNPTLGFLAMAGILSVAAIAHAGTSQVARAADPVQFYVLQNNGVAGTYGKELISGDTVRTELVVVNGGRGSTTYSVRITVDRRTVRQISVVKLAPGRSWKRHIAVRLVNGQRQESVNFLLLRAHAKKPLKTLRIWVAGSWLHGNGQIRTYHRPRSTSSS